MWKIRRNTYREDGSPTNMKLHVNLNNLALLKSTPTSSWNNYHLSPYWTHKTNSLPGLLYLVNTISPVSRIFKCTALTSLRFTYNILSWYTQLLSGKLPSCPSTLSYLQAANSSSPACNLTYPYILALLKSTPASTQNNYHLSPHWTLKANFFQFFGSWFAVQNQSIQKEKICESRRKI